MNLNERKRCMLVNIKSLKFGRSLGRNDPLFSSIGFEIQTDFGHEYKIKFRRSKLENDAWYVYSSLRNLLYQTDKLCDLPLSRTAAVQDVSLNHSCS